MKRLLKKSSFWVLLLLSLAVLLLVITQPANAQTDPTATPEEAYPPPATPVQVDDAYPLGRPTASSVETEEEYIAPTMVPEATNPPAILGENAPVATAIATPPISQSTLVRNRIVLWAGFLVTLFIFGLAVYGAILMYTRPRS